MENPPNGVFALVITLLISKVFNVLVFLFCEAPLRWIWNSALSSVFCLIASDPFNPLKLVTNRLWAQIVTSFLFWWKIFFLCLQLWTWTSWPWWPQRRPQPTSIWSWLDPSYFDAKQYNNKPIKLYLVIPGEPNVTQAFSSDIIVSICFVIGANHENNLIFHPLTTILLTGLLKRPMAEQVWSTLSWMTPGCGDTTFTCLSTNSEASSIALSKIRVQSPHLALLDTACLLPINVKNMLTMPTTKDILQNIDVNIAT